MNNKRARGYGIIVSAFLGCFAELGYAQEVSFSQMTKSTVGGITYFQALAQLPLCDSLTPPTVLRTGTNINLTFNVTRSPYCTPVEPSYYTTQVATVLGALPDGAYMLYLYAPMFGPEPGNPPLRTISGFTVTNALSSPSLTIISDSSVTNLNFDVPGVSHARYIIECSTNLVNWNPMVTNIGGPFTFTAPFQITETNRFYRTRILSAP